MPIDQNVINQLMNNDPSLTKLALRPEEDLTKEELEELVEAANNSTYLKVLIANDCGIDDEKFKVLTALKHVKTLTLGSNGIGDAGIEHFMSNNQGLIALNVGGNQIGDKGAILLANSKLRELDLYANNITDVGARSFLKNITLTNLRLAPNEEISQDLLIEVDEHIKKNESEKTNKIGPSVTARQSGSPIHRHAVAESNDNWSVHITVSGQDFTLPAKEAVHLLNELIHRYIEKAPENKRKLTEMINSTTPDDPLSHKI